MAEYYYDLPSCLAGWPRLAPTTEDQVGVHFCWGWIKSQLRQKTIYYVGRLYQGFDMDVVSQNLSRMN